MSGAPFAERAIEVEFVKLRDKQVFADSGKNSLRISGARVSVAIDASGQVAATLNLRIWGLPDSIMADMSTLGQAVIQAAAQCSVAVFAGDKGTPLPCVFFGFVITAFADYRGSPEVAFVISANTGGKYIGTQFPPDSHAGSADAVQMLSDLATRNGLAFDNTAKPPVPPTFLNNPYFPGDELTKMQAIAYAAGFNIFIDQKTLVIWPADGYREGLEMVIEPGTNMIGYPLYGQGGIDVACRFDPSLILAGTVQVKSSVSHVTGRWKVIHLNINIDALMPGGQWTTMLSLAPLEGTYRWTTGVGAGP